MTVYLPHLPECLFLLFWFMKPFYILPSGYPQIGDFLLILSFLSYILYNRSIKLNREDLLFAWFVVCVVSINTIYGIIYKNIEFFLPCSYFIFNLIGVLMFGIFSMNTGFLCFMRKLTRIMLVIQLFIYILGLGRWYGEARYMGTFNDPNQLGVFILSSFFIIKLIDFITKDKHQIFEDCICIFLIYATSSTGMAMGLTVYYISKYIDMDRNKLTKHEIYISILLLIIGMIFLITVYYNMEDIKYCFKDNFFVQRILEKFEKLFSTSSSGGNSILDDRNLDKLFLYPMTVLYGSGEAMLERFTLAKNAGELHSVPLALLFYYGIIPFTVITTWLFKKIRNIPFCVFPCIIAFLVESITLVNYRQPSFWIFFALLSMAKSK